MSNHTALSPIPLCFDGSFPLFKISFPHLPTWKTPTDLSNPQQGLPLNPVQVLWHHMCLSGSSPLAMGLSL